MPPNQLIQGHIYIYIYIVFQRNFKTQFLDIQVNLAFTKIML